MEITVPRTATVAGRMRSDVPTVLTSRPAVAISLHHLRKKKAALDVEVKKSVTSQLQKFCTYLMQVRKQALVPRCDVCFSVTGHHVPVCCVPPQHTATCTTQSEAGSQHQGVLNCSTEPALH